MPPCQDAGQDFPHQGLKKAEIPFSHLFGDIFNIHLCKMPDRPCHILTPVHAVESTTSTTYKWLIAYYSSPPQKSWSSSDASLTVAGAGVQTRFRVSVVAKSERYYKERISRRSRQGKGKVHRILDCGIVQLRIKPGIVLQIRLCSPCTKKTVTSIMELAIFPTLIPCLIILQKIHFLLWTSQRTESLALHWCESWPAIFMSLIVCIFIKKKTNQGWQCTTPTYRNDTLWRG